MYDYFRVLPGQLKPAEQFTKSDWPINCGVCWFEHRRSVPAKSKKAALQHRCQFHPWLAALLEKA